MKTHSIILATARVESPQPTYPPLAEWGLTGAVVLLCLQKGWQWFNRKEDSESQLIHSLIQSLQNTQSELLKQLVETQNNTNQAINGLKTAVDSLAQSMKAETAAIARSNYLAVRDISVRLDRLDGLGIGSEEDEPTADLRDRRQRGSSQSPEGNRIR